MCQYFLSRLCPGIQFCRALSCTAFPQLPEDDINTRQNSPRIMENFFIRYTEQLELETHGSLYDSKACVDNGVLRAPGFEMQLPFACRFFKNLAYDFLTISSDQCLYRINKHRKELEEIGRIEGTICDVSVRGDAIVIVTEKEILLFNGYFNLVKSTAFAHTVVGSQRIVWADDLFGIIEEAQMTVYSQELVAISVIKRSVACAAFISNYNKFACASEGKIRFIEPNGLEHGDPLPVASSSVAVLAVDNSWLLVTSHDTTIQVFYMKNFHWYKKLEIAGSFFCCEGNAILVRDGRRIKKHFVYGELNNGFVIDGSTLAYTNFSRAIIPPPFYYKRIALEQQITSFCFRSGRLIIATGSALHEYTVDRNDCISHISTIDISKIVKADMLQVEGSASVDDIAIVGKNIILKINNKLIKMIDQKYEFVKLDFDANLQILKIINMADEVAMLLSDGSMHHRGTQRFNLDLSKLFSLQHAADDSLAGKMSGISIADESSQDAIFLLSSGRLQKSVAGKIQEVKSDVSSFLLYKDYLIYTCKNELVVSRNGSILSRSYAEDGLALLAVEHGRIICQTRFGSLETTTCKVFARAQIASLVAAERYREAAFLCDQSHVDYEIFYRDGKCPFAVIDALGDSQILSLVRLLSPAGPALHENDSLARLRRAFDPAILYNSHYRSNPCRQIDDAGSFIQESSTAHLFADSYHAPLFSLKTSSAAAEYDTIDLNEPMASINFILKKLDCEKHPVTIVNLFVSIGRADLCFFLPDQEKIIKILTGIMSVHEITKAAAQTLSLDKITRAHRACQSDCTALSLFFNACENLQFSMLDYIEDRRTALYFLHEQNRAGGPESHRAAISQGAALPISPGCKIDEYTRQHDLFEELLMFQHFGISRFNLFCYVAGHVAPERAFYLYLHGGDRERALSMAMDNLLWREAVDVFGADESVCKKLAEMLRANARCLEAGEIYEQFLHSGREAIEAYIEGSGFREALNVYHEYRAMDWMGPIVLRLKETVRESLKNDIDLLGEMCGALKKYKERIATVRERLDENISMSQTSFSYTSLKSSKNALIKDRPGGAYEHEYVLNKIRGIVDGIIEWRERTEGMLGVFRNFEMSECISAHTAIFDEPKRTLRRDIDEIWKYERADTDPNRPKIEKPAITAWFD